MQLVVGLGNPGPTYARNRHNVGFMVVDRLAQATGADLRSAFSGRAAEVRLGGEDVVLLTPFTYMNRSGQSVRAAMDRYELTSESVLVVHDELDLPFGALRLKQGGGAGGHNGLKSLIERCGGPDFARVRIGIGRPADETPIEDWVLGDFDEEESARLGDVLEHAARAVEAAVTGGVAAAMNTFNVRAAR